MNPRYGCHAHRWLPLPLLLICVPALLQVAVAEAKRNWPFVFGFAVTGYLVVKASAALNRKSFGQRFAWLLV